MENEKDFNESYPRPENFVRQLPDKKNFTFVSWTGREQDAKKSGIDGEYLNGKRWNGKGEEYNYNYELIFEGEYLNGEEINRI